MLGSFSRLKFDVFYAATNNRYADIIIIRLVNLAFIALFKIYKMVSSSRKHIEEINHAHIVCSK